MVMGIQNAEPTGTGLFPQATSSVSMVTVVKIGTVGTKCKLFGVVCLCLLYYSMYTHKHRQTFLQQKCSTSKIFLIIVYNLNSALYCIIIAYHIILYCITVYHTVLYHI